MQGVILDTDFQFSNSPSGENSPHDSVQNILS